MRARKIKTDYFNRISSLTALPALNVIWLTKRGSEEVKSDQLVGWAWPGPVTLCAFCLRRLKLREHQTILIQAPEHLAFYGPNLRTWRASCRWLRFFTVHSFTSSLSHRF
jgi:hypothetical protein